MVELESAHHDATGVRTNQDRSIEEETSLMSPTDLADEDGYYSEWLSFTYFTHFLGATEVAYGQRFPRLNKIT